MMKEGLSYGEFGLIDQIRRRFGDIPLGGMTGIGDDCAIIPQGETRSWVITTDMLVEEVHFLRARISPFDLGYKSLAVNLSDVAAMGVAPCASFLSVALPEDLPAGWIEDFTEGYHTLSARYGVPLLGGDTTSSRQGVAISVTAIGQGNNENIKRRSDAQENDIVLVTGLLGDSAQGLRDVLSGRMDSPFVALHHRPEPALEEGIWLGTQPAVHAMMDLSDGMASDLTHILEASRLGAEVSVENIPTRVSVELAVTGGEDYQLLCTADPLFVPDLQRGFEARFARPLYAVGRIIAGKPEIQWKQHGRIVHPDWKGFTHF